MRLRELHIRNFRKIEDLTIEFPRGLTVLVGENNSGKTTIIPTLISRFGEKIFFSQQIGAGLLDSEALPSPG